MQFGLTYSATCQTYWVIWDFPVLSPDRDTLCFAQKRLFEPSNQYNNLEREIQLHFKGIKININIILSISKIYGWLGVEGSIQ
jgi:hypothetical protein